MLSQIDLSRYYLNRAIPLAFDESMSYLEMICAMLDSVNKTIDIVNKHSEFIENYEDNLTDIQTQITDLQNRLDSLLDDVDNKLDDFKVIIDEEIEQLSNSLNALINENYTLLKDYVDRQDAELLDKIENISIDSIILRDPTTGLRSNIQVVINNLYNTANTDGITAGEFDALELTAQGFDLKQITAYEFDTSGKVILSN
jgi:hypothetical protein